MEEGDSEAETNLQQFFKLKGKALRQTLVVCIGIPASGKTTFCSTFANNYRSSAIQFHHIAFDEEYSNISEGASDFIPELWHQSRKIALDKANDILEANTRSSQSKNNEHQVILLDDNFYYRSMRREVLKLARTYGCGYCQLYFHQSLEGSLEQNLCRKGSAQVREEVIRRMAEGLEPPDPTRFAWEKATLELNAFVGPPEFDAVLSFILEAGLNPVRLGEEMFAAETEMRHMQEKDRQRIAKSLSHQLDLLLRKKVGALMKTLSKEHQTMTSEEKKTVLKELSVLCKASRTHSLEQFNLSRNSPVFPFPLDEIQEKATLNNFVQIFTKHLAGSVASLPFLTKPMKENIAFCITQIET